MYVDPPTWYSKAVCPCCDQQTMAFETCSACGLVVLCCNEIGEIYAISDRTRGPVIGSFGREYSCPGCDVANYRELRGSTSAEVRALGFRWPEDYH